jgi:hypothetical protein
MITGSALKARHSKPFAPVLEPIILALVSLALGVESVAFVLESRRHSTQPDDRTRHEIPRYVATMYLLITVFDYSPGFETGTQLNGHSRFQKMPATGLAPVEATFDNYSRALLSHFLVPRQPQRGGRGTRKSLTGSCSSCQTSFPSTQGRWRHPFPPGIVQGHVVLSIGLPLAAVPRLSKRTASRLNSPPGSYHSLNSRPSHVRSRPQLRVRVRPLSWYSPWAWLYRSTPHNSSTISARNARIRCPIAARGPDVSTGCARLLRLASPEKRPGGFAR